MQTTVTFAKQKERLEEEDRAIDPEVDDNVTFTTGQRHDSSFSVHAITVLMFLQKAYTAKRKKSTYPMPYQANFFSNILFESTFFKKLKLLY